jgi:hypothetical protein
MRHSVRWPGSFEAIRFTDQTIQLSMRNTLHILLLVAPLAVWAQPEAELESWIQNTTGQTGYNNIETNVQLVQYTATDVYVTCTCIPGYDIGPWAGNPNTPANQNFCFKITRNPQANSGTLVSTPLGHVGVWTNGVSIFNARDAFSYNNGGIWNQDALPNEGASFDACLGHPAPNGEYHHHVNPTCLYDDQNTQMHSPVIGFAFDGFPIYGAYGYTDAMTPGAVSRMRSGYALRSITQRTTLPDGTVLQASQYGPAINTQYPLGKYLEDYEFTGNGDLDVHNGRVCITPEYPNGTYAYFVTIDANGTPVYPYTVGPKYYGTVQAGNTGPQSAHNTVPGTAQTYSTAVGLSETGSEMGIMAYPNPTVGPLDLILPSAGSFKLQVTDCTGRIVWADGVSGMAGDRRMLDLSILPIGVYTLSVKGETTDSNIRLLRN